MTRAPLVNETPAQKMYVPLKVAVAGTLSACGYTPAGYAFPTGVGFVPVHAPDGTPESGGRLAYGSVSAGE